MISKLNLNESFTDTIFHFTTFNGAFYIVKYDSFFLTNIIDAVREKQFNRDKLYYMSFARHFNSNMGYVGGRNTGTDFGQNYLNVRIEVDGRLLSANNKAVNVNNVGKADDVITNRQQEERLISDEPELRNVHDFIRGIYIYNPSVGNENLVTQKGVPLKWVDNLRKKILFMMQRQGYVGKIFVFNDEKAFNNLGFYKNLPIAIDKGFVVDPILIKNLAVSPSQELEREDVELGSNQIKTAGRVYALLKCEDYINNIDELFMSDNEKWNKSILEIKNIGLGILNDINSNPYNSDLIFGSLLGNNLKTNFSGNHKHFYRYIITPIYKYLDILKSLGADKINEFNLLQKWKKKLLFARHGLKYDSDNEDINKTPDVLYRQTAAMENTRFNKLKQIISESISNFLENKKDNRIKMVIFDFDGTLVDTTVIDAFRDTAKAIKDKNERLDYYKKIFDQTRPYPGIVNVLNQLNSMGIIVAVVSLSPKNMVQALCQYHHLPIQMALSVEGRKTPLNVVKGNQTGYHKSTIYNKLMGALGITQDSTLAIGDEVSDAKEARKAGIYFLGCNWGGRNEVNDISNPSEILNYIEQ